ncbi:hypothetical protein ANCDUO_07930 [Ancylostoma duodenale]|uniref:CDR ABC transporter domain-containing protein n=1 Tax=Ancylostoma duodenale TaxID=51022 RepID=A0A0C2CXP9_9BILA|nr:hypothetical protein ANCDUO_07930 [Ancylostoma duodenale]
MTLGLLERNSQDDPRAVLLSPGCPRPDGVHCYENGTDVITSLSFAPEHMWTNVIIIASMIIAIRFLAFMGLWTRAKLQR